jgi:FeS assembly protein IscX
MAHAGDEDGEETLHLYWDSTYAIVMALIQNYPSLKPADVGLEEMARLVVSLPGFCDEPGLVNERILLDIQFTWYEETTPL